MHRAELPLRRLGSISLAPSPSPCWRSLPLHKAGTELPTRRLGGSIGKGKAQRTSKVLQLELARAAVAMPEQPASQAAALGRVQAQRTAAQSEPSSTACTRTHAKRSIRTLMARSSITLLASRSIAASASAWLAKRTVPKPLSTAQVSQRPLQQRGEAGAGKMHGREPMQRRGHCLRSVLP